MNDARAGSGAGRALVCANCGAALSLDNLDERLNVVTCEHCGGVHERPALPTGTAESGRDVRAALPGRGEVALPERFEVTRPGGGLKVAWPHGRKRSAIMLGAFALLWLGLTASTGLLPLMAVAPVLGYIALVRGINRRELIVDDASLTIREGPLPWPGSTVVPRADIEQLFAVRRLSTLRTGEDGREQVQTRPHYSLSALLRGGKRRTILSGLSGIEQALWLEQEAERVLGVRDVPVAGEFAR